MTIRKKSSVPDFDKLYQSIADSFDVEDTKIHILVFGPGIKRDNLGRFTSHLIKVDQVHSYLLTEPWFDIGSNVE